MRPRRGGQERGGASWPIALCVAVLAIALCVAVGALDTIATSASPTGGRGAWQVVRPTAPVEPGKTCSTGAGGPSVNCGNYLAGALTDVSCASAGLCVAVGFEGSALVSTDPTGGPAPELRPYDKVHVSRSAEGEVAAPRPIPGRPGFETSQAGRGSVPQRDSSGSPRTTRPWMQMMQIANAPSAQNG